MVQCSARRKSPEILVKRMARAEQEHTFEFQKGFQADLKYRESRQGVSNPVQLAN